MKTVPKLQPPRTDEGEAFRIIDDAVAELLARAPGGTVPASWKSRFLKGIKKPPRNAGRPPVDEITARNNTILNDFLAFERGRIHGTDKRTDTQFFIATARKYRVKYRVKPRTIRRVVERGAESILEARRWYGRERKVVGDKEARVQLLKLRKEAAKRARKVRH